MPEQNPAREAWRRLPWRRWVARGTLFGLSAATTLSLLLFIRISPELAPQHALLPAWSWLGLACGVLNLLTLVAALAGWRSARLALCVAAVLSFGFEFVTLGAGLYLLRIPLALAAALWATGALRR